MPKKAHKKFAKKHLAATLERRRALSRRKKAYGKKSSSGRGKHDDDTVTLATFDKDKQRATDADGGASADRRAKGGKRGKKGAVAPPVYDDEAFEAAMQAKQDVGVELSDDDDNSSSSSGDGDSHDSEGPADLQSEVAAHMADLKALQEADPEFYNYLKENDGDLLAFGEDLVEAGALGDDGAQAEDDEGSDSGDEEDTQQTKKKKSKSSDYVLTKGQRITDAMLDKWETALLEHNDLRAAKMLVKAFEMGTDPGDDSPADSASAHAASMLRIASSDVFNRLMVFCLTRMGSVFDVNLRRGDADDSRRQALPHTLNGWKRIAKLVKVYVNAILRLLPQLTDAQMVRWMLKQVHPHLDYFAAFPKATRGLIKVTLGVWSSSPSVATRLVAFAHLHTLATRMPFPAIELVLKGTFLAYVRASRFMNAINGPMVAMMRSCVVQLYGLDFAASYQHAFVYVRELAITLRAAITQPTKASLRRVHSWHFVNSLYLWTAVLSHYAKQPEMTHLVYPVVQILTGVCTLLPAARHIPLRLHVITMLNDVARACDVFVPIMPHVLSVLECPPMLKRNTTSVTADSIASWSLLLRLSPAQLQCHPVLLDAVRIAVTALVRNLSTYDRSVSFPELALPIVKSLKRFNKVTADRYRKPVNAAVLAIERNTAWVKQHRHVATFAPKDVDQARAFLTNVRGKSPLSQHLKQLNATPGSALTPITWEPALQEEAKAEAVGASGDSGDEQDGSSDAADEPAQGRKGGRKSNAQRTRTSGKKRSRKGAIVAGGAVDDDDVVQELSSLSED